MAFFIWKLQHALQDKLGHVGEIVNYDNTSFLYDIDPDNPSVSIEVSKDVVQNLHEKYLDLREAIDYRMARYELDDMDDAELLSNTFPYYTQVKDEQFSLIDFKNYAATVLLSPILTETEFTINNPDQHRQGYEPYGGVEELKGAVLFDAEEGVWAFTETNQRGEGDFTVDMEYPGIDFENVESEVISAISSFYDVDEKTIRLDEPEISVEVIGKDAQEAANALSDELRITSKVQGGPEL